MRAIFENAEELWFWYYGTEKAKANPDFDYPKKEIKRPTYPMIIWNAVTSLRMKGKLTHCQYLVLLNAGKNGFIPDPKVHQRNLKYALALRGPDGEYRDEREAYKLWLEAIEIFGKELKRIGLVKNDK